MTDITDQDRRDARKWAEYIAKTSKYDDEITSETHAAVNYILATVEAPEPTLAEDILDAAARIRDAVNPGDRDVSWADMESCADRTAHMEHDLAEAHAKVDHLKRDIAEAYETSDARDDEVARLRAEVERLTAERDTHTETHSDNAVTDPADVKPGGAWIVECRGERRTAVKDMDDDLPWNTVAADGLFFSEKNENVTILHRLVPAPRVITKPDELDRAKRCTVIRDAAGVVCERNGMGDAWTTFNSLANQRPHIALPATVLWEPGV